jgi:4-hydroxy-tetrahydrodipicolinate reductase
MKIALLGYGRMGQTIDSLASERGHEIIKKLENASPDAIREGLLGNADVVIDFTMPNVAAQLIMACFDVGIPVVSGTTGWLGDYWEEVVKHCKDTEGTFFYASNYSIGVNIFFELNAQLARLMNGQSQYQIEMEEIHHIHKIDAPSGTAISLADGIINNLEHADTWHLMDDTSTEKKTGFPIISKREGEVPGTHIVRYHSPIDSIEISHTAKGREGFAMGAILASEWLVGKEGVFGMKDMLGFG